MSGGLVRLDPPAGEAQALRPSGRKIHPREPGEHYVEERWVSRRLFEARDFGGVIVDPCAGFGHIVFSARACGLRAYGSDLVKRARGVVGGADFLAPDWRPPRRVGRDKFAIVCNPPFGGRKPLIRDFARAALARARHVALLIPAGRLAAAGVWLEDLPLVEVLHVSPRSSLLPGREHAERTAQGLDLGRGFADVAWLIFRRGQAYAGRTGWLRRDG